MTEDQIRREIKELSDRIEDLENERDAIKRLPDAVARLQGAVDVLQGMISKGFEHTEEKIEGTTSFKNALQFASVILVPLLVALIGLYAVTHGGHP